MHDQQVQGIGGPINNQLPHGWLADYLDAVQFYRHRISNGVVDYLLTANVAFQRKALLTVAGFYEVQDVWGEDADLSFRLKSAGYNLGITSAGVVTHHGSPCTLKELIRVLYRYGRGSAILSRHWQNGRTPLYELVRHSAAVFLAPILAVRLIRRAGFVHALSFWPIIVLEHTAFCWGILTGITTHGGQS